MNSTDTATNTIEKFTIHPSLEKSRRKLASRLNTTPELAKDKLIEVFGKHTSIKDVCDELNLSRDIVSKLMGMFDVNKSHLKDRDKAAKHLLMNREPTSFTKEAFEQAVKESDNWNEVATKLNYSKTNQMRLKLRADKWGTDYKHFPRFTTINRILDSMTREETAEKAEKASNWREFIESCGCPVKLGSIRIAKSKLEDMEISTTHFTQAEWSQEQFMEAVKNASNFRQVIKNLGLKGLGNYKTIYSYIDRNNIDISHFDSTRPNWTKEQFADAAKKSYSLSELKKNLSGKSEGSLTSVKAYIKKNDVDVSHFTTKFKL